jgi:antitoxin component of RelBE/YafQ-DinJ toxin-antitoxin module
MNDSMVTLRGLDRDLRDAFKAICALRGVSMKEALESYMRESVKEKTLPLLHKERSGELFRG